MLLLLLEIKSKVVDAFVGAPPNNENINDDFDSKLTRYTDIVNTQCNDKKYNDVKITKEINEIFKTNKRKADDDLEVIDEGLKERDFKCPYSGGLFIKPMKHKACKHRLDYDSIKNMCQNRSAIGTAKCPQPGCNQIWKFTDCEVDEELMFKMGSFQRQQERSQKDVSANGTFVDDDQEYTHI